MEFLFAYLDPGTGSVVLQALAGLFIGVAATVKVYWNRIQSWFPKDKDKPDDHKKNEDLRS